MRKVQDVLDVTGAPRHRKPEIGDTRWDGTEWRRWDGASWTLASHSVRPEALRRPGGYRQLPEIDPERRTAALEQVAWQRVTTRGAAVVLTTPTTLVLGYPRRVSHLLHAVLTVLTGGLWAVVWLALFLGGREDRVRYEVDRWGNVWSQDVAPRLG